MSQNKKWSLFWKNYLDSLKKYKRLFFLKIVDKTKYNKNNIKLKKCILVLNIKLGMQQKEHLEGND